MPVWTFALGFAAIAPFAAKALATTFERHARAKSRRIVGRAGSANTSSVVTVKAS
jgi:hypothetical protein